MIIACAAASFAERRGGGIEVVFLAGEGFLISAGHSRVLVDALYDLNVEDGKPPRAHDHLDREGLSGLERAEKPFDGVDAVLVTHAHDDHFTAKCAAGYLKSNGWAVLAGTAEVTTALLEFPGLSREEGERLLTADVKAGEVDTFVIDGITVYALGMRHTGCRAGPDATGGTMPDGSPCVSHVAWLVETSGRRILHLGDAKSSAEEFEQFPWLAGIGIDVAFVPFWFIEGEEGIEIINRLIVPEAVVLMHWNRWNRESVAGDLERLGADLPPVAMFSEHFERMAF